MAVSVSVANDTVSLPVAYQLYPPESWACDRRRRRASGVPDAVPFQPKWQIALDQLRAAASGRLVAGARRRRRRLWRHHRVPGGPDHRRVPYIVGVKGNYRVAARPPLSPEALARPRPSALSRAAHPAPRPPQSPAPGRRAPDRACARYLARGTRGVMRSRFARLRVRPAHRDVHRAAPRPVEWLLIEWPRGEAEPTKYWLSTLPHDRRARHLVRLAKLRWLIERDYQELKHELGLDHFEGRGWRGFHHHGALCIAAYAFLAAERARLSPPEPRPSSAPARLPKGFKPRGAPRAA